MTARNANVTGGDLPKPHYHSLGELPLGIGPGRIARLEPGLNVSFTPTGEVGTFQVNAVAGGGGVLREFVWVPGGATDATQGRYNTFAAAHAAALAAQVLFQGPVTLYALGDADNDITIEAAAAYDMTDIEFVGVSGLDDASPPTVRVPNGTTFQNPAKMSNMRLYYSGAGAFITVATGLVGIVYDWGPNFLISPFGGGAAGTCVSVVGAGSLEINLLDNSVFQGGDGGGEVVDVAAAGVVTINVYSRVSIQSDTIRGVLAATLLVVREGSSTVDDQPGFLGSYAGPAAGNLPYQSQGLTAGWDYVTGGLPPVTVNAALTTLVESRWLFGAAFDPQSVLSVSQGQIQPALGATLATTTLQGSGMLTTFTALSPGPTFVGSAPALTFSQQTLAAAGSIAAIHYAGDANVFDLAEGGTRYSDIFLASAWTSIRFFTGLIADATTAPVQSDAPVADHVALQFSTVRGDTNFQVSTSIGGLQVLNDTGVAPVANRYYRFDVIYTGLGGDTYAFLWDLQSGALPYAAVFVGGAGGLTGTFFSGIEAQAAAARSIGRCRTAVQQRMSLLRPTP